MARVSFAYCIACEWKQRGDDALTEAQTHARTGHPVQIDWLEDGRLATEDVHDRTEDQGA